MKITLDIHDELLVRAKRHAQETGRPLRALVEDGLRRVTGAATPRHRYELPDLRVGDPDAPDPLVTYSWPELRELIYGGSGARWSRSMPTSLSTPIGERRKWETGHTP